MEVIADQFGYWIFPGYLMEALYLALRNISGFLLVNVLRCVILGVLAVILFRIYRRTKYADDGRYEVSRVEFLGVHVRLSLLTAWVCLSFVHECFMCLSYSHSYNGHQQTFLDWENSSWSILVMLLTFAWGVIFLSMYKDIFYPLMLAYAYIGIYFMQAHEEVCTKQYEYNCSTNVSKSALVLATLLVSLSMISLWFNYRLICYKRRPDTNSDKV